MQSGQFTVKMILAKEEHTFNNADIIEISIVEDIFTFGMTGSITFYDKTGFTEMLDVVGTDPIIIIWKEGGIERRKAFIVLDYHRIFEETTMDTTITKVVWYFIEPIYISLLNKTYSKSWGNKTLISDVINDISSKMLNIAEFKNFEPTRESITGFYIPFWNPAEAIRWLMKRASGSKSLLPGYLFYSNSLGNNFLTLETLVKSTDRELDVDNKKAKYTFTGTGDDFTKILSWYVDPAEVFSAKYLSGSTIYGYTPVTNGEFGEKYHFSKQYTYSDAINKYSLLGKFSLFPDISDAGTNTQFQVEQSEEMIDNIYFDDFIKRYTKQFAVGIVVKGHTRRYAGMLIDILWRSNFKKFKKHNMYGGLYLVRSITHQFTPGVSVTPNYRQLLICMKTGYDNLDTSKTLKAVNVISDSNIVEEKK